MSEPDKTAKAGAKASAEGSARGSAKRSSGESPSSGSRSSADSVAQVRNAVGTAVWLIAVVCAVLLAVGALFVVLDFNRGNGLVKFFIDAADNVNVLGTLKEFKPDGKGASAEQSAEVKNVLVNWGICAVVYLVVGKIAERLVRP